MVLLILESLGSTELLFILAMALVFFGPRKLPQLSRSLGKSMAEFRRASEDFKRTWDREANLEGGDTTATVDRPPVALEDNSTLARTNSGGPLQPPMIETVSPERVIARQSIPNDDPNSVVEYADAPASQSETSRKRDWL